VFDAPGDLGDDVVFGGKLQRPGVDDPLGCGGHHPPDGRPLPAEFVGEFDGLDRRNRARDPERDVDSFQHTRLWPARDINCSGVRPTHRQGVRLTYWRPNYVCG